MKLSLVIPCKNQTAKLVANLKSTILPYFDALGFAYEILIVSDGSDEPNQNALLLALKSFPDNVRLVPFQAYQGKGHNVQRGFLSAEGDYAMFMDADLSTDIHTLDRILSRLGEADAFVASRYAEGAEILVGQTGIRRLISSLARKLIKKNFHFAGISDTQCGFKLFQTPLAKLLAQKQKEDGFVFDVEYLYMLQLNGCRVLEVPCRWKDDRESSMHHPLRTAFAFYREMKRIKKRKGEYLFSPEEKARLLLAPSPIERNGDPVQGEQPC